MSKKCKWDDDCKWDHYWFTCILGVDGTQHPWCVLCTTYFQVLTSSHQNCQAISKVSMVVLPGIISVARSIYQHNLVSWKHLDHMRVPYCRHHINLHIYMPRRRVLKPHTTGKLVKPCALKIAQIILGPDAQKKLQQLPFCFQQSILELIKMSQDRMF